MILTNYQNLPAGLLKAVSKEQHNHEGEYSATTLLKGTKEIILTKRHWDEITVDVSDMVWAIFGQAVHALLEHETPDTFVEEKLSADIGRVKVTGRLDLYDMKNGIVEDWKTASTWKIIFKDYADWDKQGKIYAWLLRKNDFPASSVRFIALLKDHSKSKARRDILYPQKPCVLHDIKISVSDIIETEQFVNEKIKNILAYQLLEDDEIPACTKEERWASDDEWAVIKEGMKRAVRVYTDERTALEHVAKEKDLTVEHRPGESKKCLEYCQCKDFCSFYKGLKNTEVKE